MTQFFYPHYLSLSLISLRSLPGLQGVLQPEETLDALDHAEHHGPDQGLQEGCEEQSGHLLPLHILPILDDAWLNSRPRFYIPGKRLDELLTSLSPVFRC